MNFLPLGYELQRYAFGALSEYYQEVQHYQNLFAIKYNSPKMKQFQDLTDIRSMRKQLYLRSKSDGSFSIDSILRTIISNKCQNQLYLKKLLFLQQTLQIIRPQLKDFQDYSYLSKWLFLVIYQISLCLKSLNVSPAIYQQILKQVQGTNVEQYKKSIHERQNQSNLGSQSLPKIFSEIRVHLFIVFTVVVIWIEFDNVRLIHELAQNYCQQFQEFTQFMMRDKYKFQYHTQDIIKNGQKLRQGFNLNSLEHYHPQFFKSQENQVPIIQQNLSKVYKELYYNEIKFIIIAEEKDHNVLQMYQQECQITKQTSVLYFHPSKAINQIRDRCYFQTLVVIADLNQISVQEFQPYLKDIMKLFYYGKDVKTLRSMKLIKIDNVEQVTKVSTTIKSQILKNSENPQFPNFSFISSYKSGSTEFDQTKVKLNRLSLIWMTSQCNMKIYKHLFNDISDYIFIHKSEQIKLQSAQNPDAQILPQIIQEQINNGEFENQVIRNYTCSSYFYRMINRSLRSLGNIQYLPYFRYPVKALYDKIRNLYLQEDQPSQIFYRCCKFNKHQLQYFEFNTKKIIQMQGFISTTRSKPSKLFGEHCLIIKVPFIEKDLLIGGFADILKYSTHKNEKETLFNPLNYFRIKNYSQTPHQNKNYLQNLGIPIQQFTILIQLELISLTHLQNSPAQKLSEPQRDLLLFIDQNQQSATVTQKSLFFEMGMHRKVFKWVLKQKIQEIQKMPQAEYETMFNQNLDLNIKFDDSQIQVLDSLLKRMNALKNHRQINRNILMNILISDLQANSDEQFIEHFWMYERQRLNISCLKSTCLLCKKILRKLKDIAIAKKQPPFQVYILDINLIKFICLQATLQTNNKHQAQILVREKEQILSNYSYKNFPVIFEEANRVDALTLEKKRPPQKLKDKLGSGNICKLSEVKQKIYRSYSDEKDMFQTINYYKQQKKNWIFWAKQNMMPFALLQVLDVFLSAYLQIIELQKDASKLDPQNQYILRLIKQHLEQSSQLITTIQDLIEKNTQNISPQQEEDFIYIKTQNLRQSSKYFQLRQQYQNAILCQQQLQSMQKVDRNSTYRQGKLYNLLGEYQTAKIILDQLLNQLIKDDQAFNITMLVLTEIIKIQINQQMYNEALEDSKRLIKFLDDHKQYSGRLKIEVMDTISGISLALYELGYLEQCQKGMSVLMKFFQKQAEFILQSKKKTMVAIQNSLAKRCKQYFLLSIAISDPQYVLSISQRLIKNIALIQGISVIEQAISISFISPSIAYRIFSMIRQTLIQQQTYQKKLIQMNDKFIKMLQRYPQFQVLSKILIGSKKQYSQMLISRTIQESRKYQQMVVQQLKKTYQSQKLAQILKDRHQMIFNKELASKRRFFFNTFSTTYHCISDNPQLYSIHLARHEERLLKQLKQDHNQQPLKQLTELYQSIINDYDGLQESILLVKNARLNLQCLNKFTQIKPLISNLWTQKQIKQIFEPFTFTTHTQFTLHQINRRADLIIRLKEPNYMFLITSLSIALIEQYIQKGNHEPFQAYIDSLTIIKFILFGIKSYPKKYSQLIKQSGRLKSVKSSQQLVEMANNMYKLHREIADEEERNLESKFGMIQN